MKNLSNQKIIPFDYSNLFTERYKELIHTGNGEPVDNISGNIDFSIKEKLSAIIFKFREPKKIASNRYDNSKIETDVLEISIKQLNDFLGYPAIQTDNFFTRISEKSYLANNFTPFLFDLIELQYNDLSTKEKGYFRKEINNVFKTEKVQFILSDSGIIDRLIDYEVLDDTIEKCIQEIAEPGLKELLNEACSLHKQSDYSSHKNAVEKIWDAFERLKTYYSDLDKKKSADKIVTNMAGGKEDFKNIFDSEFEALTKIGNKFRIRHHETDKTDIKDIQYYDYFFNRCLSLIALAIQYLE